jgi:diacylglycerol kinase family enzyme
VSRMTTTEVKVPGGATVAQRWLARLALVAAAAAVLGPPLVAGLRQSLALVLVGLAGLALTAAAVWWALAHKGLVRALAVVLAVATPLTVLVLYRGARLLWVVLVALGLLALAVAAGRAALRRDAIPERLREHEVAPPERPFLIMNPRSGGGKVTRFRLKDKAEALGATVAVLEGPGTVDVGALARQAVAEGADLLGVAGGDGTQALVAGIATEHNLPLLVISAGTRNHFALDLGLDRDDPSRCLDALGDGVELHVDLGFIGDRPFVNNASFGAYAAVVQSPAYRDDKARTTTELLPDLLAGQKGPRLVARAGNVTIEGPQAVLVSNNVYGMGDIAGLGRRARLDRGTLGLFAVTVASAVQAAGLLAGTQSRGLTRLAAPEVVVDADAAQIPVGVDGEALLLDTPVRCTIQPAALRVRVPRDRPGVPDPKPIMDWKRLWQIALTVPRPVRSRPSSIAEQMRRPGHASGFSSSRSPIRSSR